MREGIQEPVKIVSQMEKQVGVKVLATDGTPPDECVKFCVDSTAIKAADRLSFDLSTCEVKGTILPTTVSQKECQKLMEKPARFPGEEGAEDRLGSVDPHAELFDPGAAHLRLGAHRCTAHPARTE
jgi:hypothetical protein